MHHLGGNQQCGRFDFVGTELRGLPKFRTTTSVFEACAVVRETQLAHFKGQYGEPLFCLLPNFSYEEQNIPDIAHMLSGVMKSSTQLAVGHGARGGFKEWDTRRDRIHQAECELFHVFPESWLHHERPQLRWRLGDAELLVVDLRVRRIVYPHHCETVGTPKMSFWRDTALTWKMSQRLLAFLVIIPTCLRGYVTQLHCALLKLVWGIRILDGQVHSYNRAIRSIKVEPGCPCLAKEDISLAHTLIATGLSMLEGCIPVCVRI